MDAAKKKIRRSRNGCHNCKRLKIKCDEQKPVCSYCAKTRATCDYSIKLTWGGRPYRDTNKRPCMPEISDGIESLSSALEKASNGGQQFLLHNSEIFNNFLSGNMDVKISEDVDDHMRANPTQAAESKKFPNEDFFSSYSEDLARIEAYLPARSPNFGGDFFALSNSFHEIFATIPPSITPLPEILLHVPFYRNLMHFWVNVASDHLVPAPPHLYKDNPFKILLPQMAMEYPSILTTLLAFSASIRSSLVGANDTPEIVTDQLLSRSCHELLKLLKDSKTATSDYTLATVLLLSCYEVFNSKDFNKHRAHTVGARQIIMARNQSAIKKEQSSVIGTESDITFFLMRWFVYVDIIGALSSTRNNHNYISKSDNIHSYTPAESVTTLNELDKHIEQNPKRDIDHLLGFDVKFLPQFSEIALLIRRTNSYLSREGVDKDAIPFEIVARALEVKENLMKAYEIGERRRQKKLDEAIDHRIQQKKKQTNSTSPPNLTHLIEHDNTIRTTNKIFCDTGILNLYRRVLKIPRESSLVQDLANNIGSMQMKYIESRSPADICTIFCTFAAGCETQDGKMQQFFNDRFSCLIEMGNVNALKGLKIMKRCWETGEDWIVASRTLDIDMALL
ncbi:fungal transcriptional regulatory protein [Scheffersomyces stipitis CBS 6054]|uniref:Fungal transcriptional regulatory protein n=1 Tax=Scheffersomyces stipitis (strain ATCC 58785 / CBS 6054 / NBRC 10063 / NRRL Y-11545) TaxID=322104 RepID=A3GHG9_PICST|nr:fungal transcriptional regulatory protein [Scheffersomyces stipitis CBS 6054]EAZ62816.2 fungal transcriptional regulatory protein [Scheffersomyces stipitis CBS 6054]